MNAGESLNHTFCIPLFRHDDIPGKTHRPPFSNGTGEKLAKIFPLVFTVLVLLPLVACSSLPSIHPLDSYGAAGIQKACTAPFPPEKRQYVHAIHATLPNGDRPVFMGVTIIDPAMETIDCALLSIEGLVLFEGRYDGKITIHRALPPLDTREFARGLIRDIRLIFFHPPGKLSATGRLESGASVCRFTNTDGTVVDVITRLDNTWALRQYSGRSKLTRSVTTHFKEAITDHSQFKIPDEITLTASGPAGYTLEMDLISTERIP